MVKNRCTTGATIRCRCTTCCGACATRAAFAACYNAARGEHGACAGGGNIHTQPTIGPGTADACAAVRAACATRAAGYGTHCHSIATRIIIKPVAAHTTRTASECACCRAARTARATGNRVGIDQCIAGKCSKGSAYPADAACVASSSGDRSYITSPAGKCAGTGDGDGTCAKINAIAALTSGGTIDRATARCA